MNQPELGIAISKLRAQKGLSQEKLAECCEVSKRTIQRIESGEVIPRVFTMNNLSNILEFDFNGENSQNETIWITLLHLSSCLPITMLIFPLIVWSKKKKSSLKIEEHGKAVLNFQITIILMISISFVILMLALGTVIVFDELGLEVSDLVYTGISFLASMPAVLITLFAFFQGIINALRSISDRPVRYRMSIPFVKI